MRRWLSCSFIVAYLGALLFGVVSHAIQFGHTSHPGMYFLVWDMFCGWSAYEGRTHIIGEADDGTYYNLVPGPWGPFKPFGDLDRRHYDVLFNASHRFALNTLRHTEHKPMARIYVVEECWAKKFNVPDHVWQRRHDEPKDFKSYYHLKSILSPEGTLLASYPNWLSRQAMLAVTNNPRLEAEARRSRDFLAVTPRQRVAKGAIEPHLLSDPAVHGLNRIPLGTSAH